MGYTLEDILVERDWFHRGNPFPEYREEIINAWKRDVIQKGVDRVFSVVCKDGEVKEIEFKPTLMDDRTIIVIFSDITEGKRAEEALRVSEEKYHLVVEHANQGILIAQDGVIKFSNLKLSEILGYSQEELFSKPFTEFIYTDDREMVVENHLKRLQGIELPHIYAFRMMDEEGNIKWLEINAALFTWKGRPATLNFLSDITERKRAEEEMDALQEQFRHSQKMEAIGRLAGGIAHDFNNLLTVIKGYSQLSLHELKEEAPLKGNFEEINRASEKASDLTRQLLSFSRSQMMEMKVVDLNSFLKNLDKMLRRVVGEDVELITFLADDLGRIKVDPGQIEQVIMNLVVNAKDAMPSGGKLAIETANVELDEVYARSHIGVKPGPYVMLLVSDTGTGVAPEVKKKVFEPFFTTKEKDKGTGLGLSTVYGIVKQSGGDIWVYSEPCYGTTFKIYFPRVNEPQDIEGVKENGVEEGLPHGDETILVVEDDEEVRKITGRILRMQGYRVLEAPNGGDVFSVCDQHEGPIHLTITDVVMPEMKGSELAKRLSSSYPEMKVIYMSGYVEDVISRQGILEKGMEYLQKPFTVNDLANKVREALDK
jgi:PAS domain S-box-containing protein